MLRNYFKTAFRFIRRSLVFSVINIFGLAVGICCSLLILLYVHREVSFDRFHSNIDQLYRLKTNLMMQGKDNHSAITGLIMGPGLAENFPEIQTYVRLIDLGGMVEYEHQAHRNISGFFADSNFFQVFSFPLLHGDPSSVLSRPNSVVLARSLAERIFGEENPVGKTISWNHMIECTVTGVVKDPPEYSHLDFDMIINMESYVSHFNPYISWDGGFSFYTYLQLEPGASPGALEEKFIPFMYEKINRRYEEYGARIDLALFPVRKIRMFADYKYELGRTGTFTRTVIFAGIALLILLIAAFNYVNLTTARASQRAREVGIRKAAGAGRRKLVRQFITESLFMTLVAGVLALILVELLQPSFNRLAGTEMSLYSLPLWQLLAGYPLLLLLLGTLSSLYPALRLSAIDPIRTLRGMTESVTGKPVLRDALVVVQYIISVVLIIGTTFVYLQLDFLQKKDIGFKKQDLIIIPMINDEQEEKASLLAEELRKLPQVSEAGMGSGVPGYGLTMNGYVPEGYEKPMMFHALDIDPHYIPALGIRIMKGRNFSEDLSTDRSNILINETLARELGWDDPIGKTIERDSTLTVIGVLGDFHYSPVQQKINPLIVTNSPDRYTGYVVARLVNSIPSTTEAIEKAFSEVFPGTSFYATYMEDRLSDMFRNEQKFATTVLIAAILAVFLASLGLFALSLFAAQRRTREIGVRKAMGSDSLGIVVLFFKEFTARVLLANLLAYPIVWYAVRRWLLDYEYHIELSPWVFLAGTLVSLVLTLLTVGYQSLRASMTNPAQVLKYE